MKIGLAGTISVGKTTLVKELAQLEQFKDYFVSTERSKYLRDLGIPLNTDSTVKGQIVFAAERSSELFHENLLTDRSIYDVCTFTGASKTISFENKKTLVEAFMLLKDEYDVIIYVSPKGVEIEDNGVRETNSEFRDTIDDLIQTLIKEYPPKKLICVSGTTEERISTILEHLS